MNILGLNAYHPDAAASLLVDGKVVFAAEEERFSRIKHHYGYPHNAIIACLEKANLASQDISAITYSYCATSNLWPKAAWLIRHPHDLWKATHRLLHRKNTAELKRDRGSIFIELQKRPIVGVDHHCAHLAAAFFGSPFLESTLISLDGMGDFCSSSIGYAKSNQLYVGQRTNFPHSLGYLYSMITMMLGFSSFGDEYKVMGLAPYGTPKYRRHFRELIALDDLRIVASPLARPRSLSDLSLEHQGHSPSIQCTRLNELRRYFNVSEADLKDPLGVAADIASSLQERLEELVFQIINQAIARFSCKNVCFAGGVALNSVAVGKITEHTYCKELYVPPAPADNGTSFGSALYHWHVNLKNEKYPTAGIPSALLGTVNSEQEIVTALEVTGLPFKELSTTEILESSANLLVSGNVIAWVQGEMEFGARALGNRSLLADPRSSEMRDRINTTVKNRELFRPLAPSVPEELAHEYFLTNERSPFMERVCLVAPEKKYLLGAVTHSDGTARVQTVSKEAQPLYWQLLHTFGALSGVPILLNTSFNQQEPIVRTAAEAVATFMRSDIDALVIHNYLIRKQG
jgi:carbamoyltransferase